MLYVLVPAMAAVVVLEVPTELQAGASFLNSIIRIEHLKDPIVCYGCKVPRVTMDTGAEQLGFFLGCKPLFGNLFSFEILFEGVACTNTSVGADINALPWTTRPDGLIVCGADRVYVSPTLIAPLPPLR